MNPEDSGLKLNPDRKRMRYSVDGVIETPDGRNARLRAVWLIDEYGEPAPRIR